jgi:DNA polymerase III sliding clamp (beta) subunit (PCNA family)
VPSTTSMQAAFSLPREAFAGAVRKVAEGIPAKPPQPAYAGILLQDGFLTTSDGDVTFRASVDYQGQGVILPPILADIAPRLTGDTITLEIKETAELTAGKSRYTFTIADGKGYPAWPGGPDAILPADLADALRKVLPAASDTHPVLRCVHFSVQDNRLALACTDDAALGIAWVDTEGDIPGEALVPARTMEKIRKVTGKGHVGWDDTKAIFTSDGLSVIVRQVQGKFKQWRRIIAEDAWVIADRKEVITAVRNVLTVKPPMGNITLTFTTGSVQVSAQGPLGHAQEEAEVNYDGPSVSYLLGSGRLLPGLAGCDEMASISFTRPPKPLILAGNDYRWYVQPRREV